MDHQDLIFCASETRSNPTLDRLDSLIEELSANVKPKRFIGSGFEKESRLEPVKQDLMSRNQRRREALQMKHSVTGPKWFDMRVRDMDMDDKLTLDAIKLRETLDPTRFYKKKATDNIDKHFQIGKIVQHPMDYYSGRATRKEIKPTLVDELISDTKFRQTVKKRYARIKSKKIVKENLKRIIERRRQKKQQKSQQRKPGKNKPKDK